MADFDVSFHQAERLIDTEISYVLNRANLEQYRRFGVGKITIVNLDVNTCEKCKALEGQVFAVDDAPVLPIHPRCHCSYCVPADGDDAEITASGGDLDSVYADAGVKGYESAKPRAASALQARIEEAAGPKVSRVKPAAKPADKAQAPAENDRSEGNVLTSTGNVPVDAVNKPTVDLPASKGIDIMTSSTQAAGDGVITVGKLNIKAFSAVVPELQTDSLVITEKQIAHSNDHEKAYEKYGWFIPEVAGQPDYVFADTRPNTGIAVKKTPEAGDKSLQVVIRVKVAGDPEGNLNSVISCWVISKKRLATYLRNREILYKADEV